MKSKKTYKYPAFVEEVTLEKTDDKRYWLNLDIDKNKKESILILLKNPSRANKEISDKTVFTVCTYVYRNREKYEELEDIGNIIILNLIPNYETYSDKLKSLKSKVIDPQNLKTINDFCRKNKKVIIAWGNHPQGLFYEYEKLKSSVMEILYKNQNDVFYVDKMSIAENPKHGQVWGYVNELKSFK